MTKQQTSTDPGFSKHFLTNKQMRWPRERASKDKPSQASAESAPRNILTSSIWLNTNQSHQPMQTELHYGSRFPSLLAWKVWSRHSWRYISTESFERDITKSVAGGVPHFGRYQGWMRKTHYWMSRTAYLQWRNKHATMNQNQSTTGKIHQPSTHTQKNNNNKEKKQTKPH